MNAKRPGERLDGGEQSLLQAADEQARAAWVRFDSPLQTLLAQLAVFVEQFDKRSSGRRREDRRCPPGPPSARGSRRAISRMSSLRRRTMTSSRSFGRDRHAAAKALRVEDLQQRGEAVRVSVVRGRREEEPVLEPAARSRTARVIFESMAYFAPLAGAAWCASSRMSSVPGRKSAEVVAQPARRRPRRSDRRVRDEERGWVVQGFTPYPRSRRTRAM